jgi:trigger factor
MAVTVESLGALERKITLTLSAAAMATEVETRLKKIAKTVKMSGFRPGKVPINIVTQQYGYSAQYEVMNERVGAAFNTAVTEANLNVAGQPKINELEAAAGSDELKFEAVFEVYPKIHSRSDRCSHRQNRSDFAKAASQLCPARHGRWRRSRRPRDR